MSNIEKQLEIMKYDFDPYFHSRVLHRLHEVQRTFRWSILTPFAGVAVMALLWVFVVNGSLEMDSLLGIDTFGQTIDNYLMDY